eukprot:108015-Rhodomonas_salina.1
MRCPFPCREHSWPRMLRTWLLATAAIGRSSLKTHSDPSTWVVFPMTSLMPLTIVLARRSDELPSLVKNTLHPSEYHEFLRHPPFSACPSTTTSLLAQSCPSTDTRPSRPWVYHCSGKKTRASHTQAPKRSSQLTAHSSQLGPHATHVPDLAHDLCDRAGQRLGPPLAGLAAARDREDAPCLLDAVRHAIALRHHLAVPPRLQLFRREVARAQPPRLGVRVGGVREDVRNRLLLSHQHLEPHQVPVHALPRAALPRLHLRQTETHTCRQFCS